MNRQKLNDDIEHLAKKVLPKRAKQENYPVRFDHCFLRIAYDATVGGKWDESIDRPFKHNASTDQLETAKRRLEQMVEDPNLCHRLNEKSLKYR
jgi:hypothetical protein